MDMISNRPYLIRAFYQWIVDSGCTPILVIDAHHPRCKIPEEFADDGEIVFTVSPVAVRDLYITNEKVEFNASFSGVIHLITAPVNAVLSMYAEENGEGIFFDSDEEMETSHPEPSRLTSISNTGEALLREAPGNDKPTMNGLAENKKASKPFLKLIE